MELVFVVVAECDRSIRHTMRRSEESVEDGTRQFDFERKTKKKQKIGTRLVVDFAGVFLMENGNYFHFNFFFHPALAWNLLDAQHDTPFYGLLTKM